MTEPSMPRAAQRSLQVFPAGSQRRVQSPSRALHGRQPGRGVRDRGYDRCRLPRFLHGLGLGTRGTRPARGGRVGRAPGGPGRELWVHGRELPSPGRDPLALQDGSIGTSAQSAGRGNGVQTHGASAPGRDTPERIGLRSRGSMWTLRYRCGSEQSRLNSTVAGCMGVRTCELRCCILISRD